MEDALLAQGVQLMLVGMGSVFVFLTLLVIATTAMSALVRKYLQTPVVPVAKADGALTEEELAAIGAAIAMHRNTHRH